MILMRKAILIWALAIAILACSGDSTPPVATIDGENITREQFEAFLKFKRVNEQNRENLERVLDEYLKRSALAKSIEKEKALDAQMVEAELAEFRKEMLISRYFERFLENKADEKNVANYYNTHIKDYETKKVKVAHILLRTRKNMGETERAAKLTRAGEAYAKIQVGQPFETVAAEFSEDKVSASKGGDLGWVKEGSVDPVFSEKVFSLKKGDVSPPFETAFGYHIVKIQEEPKTVTTPLQSVQGEIRYKLRNQLKEEETKRLLGQVKMEKGAYRAK